MPWLTTLVAGLSRSVHWTTIGSGAVTGDMALLGVSNAQIPTRQWGVPVCRRHSTSWLAPGSRERNG